MNKKTHVQIGLMIIKSVFLILLTAVIAAFSRFLFIDNMFEQEYFSEQVLNIFFGIFFILIFNSLTISIDKYDKYSYLAFSERVKNNKLISHIKFILLSIGFYVELFCVLVVSIILPPSFLYGFVNKIFFNGIELTSLYSKLYTLLIMLPIMFTILFVAHIMLQKSWYINAQNEKVNSAKAKKSKCPPIVKSIVTVAIIYCGASMAIPWLLPMFITLWNLGGIMLFVWILIALIVLILSTVIAYYIRAILKRKFFVKKLKKYCAANSVYLSNIKNTYVSLFGFENGFNFTIEKNYTKYDCKFIACLFPSAPIILSDKGNGLRQYTVRLFRVELLHFLTKFDFGYESENKKILILLPTPKTFFVSVNDTPPHIADVGEKTGEYTVYNSSGFLGALDRNCL